MKAINTNLGSTFIKFTFSDSDGDVFAHFKMNPTDTKMHARVRGTDAKLDELKKNFADMENNAENMEKLNAAVEDLFCWLFGYDVKECLFGFVSALSVLPDGTQFYEKVLEAVANGIAPEIAARAEKMSSRLEKYTGDYK